MTPFKLDDSSILVISICRFIGGGIVMCYDLEKDIFRSYIKGLQEDDYSSPEDELIEIVKRGSAFPMHLAESIFLPMVKDKYSSLKELATDLQRIYALDLTFFNQQRELPV